ncbi:MAG: nucleotidyltransferase domain-containing protein [Armatimonadetes bacterium]|nr:nucleotidyltransferase domain-containing protein [Armatimonadota bacterium]
MARTRTELISTIIGYVAELERLGIPVERVILYGSHQRGQAHEDSDIDLAVFSEAFGPPDYLEFSGVLSEAKWNTEPMIEVRGYHPSALVNVPKISFLNEIVTTGEVVYQRGVKKVA